MKFLPLALILVCGTGYSADYLSPLQAPQVQKQVSPVQKVLQAPFQAPVQKAVQSPVQKLALADNERVAPRRRLGERLRARRERRAEARAEVGLGLFGGCG